MRGSEEEIQGTEGSHKVWSISHVTAIVVALGHAGTLQASVECLPQNFPPDKQVGSSSSTSEDFCQGAPIPWHFPPAPATVCRGQNPIPLGQQLDNHRQNMNGAMTASAETML